MGPLGQSDYWTGSMSQSRESPRPQCTSGNDGARGAAEGEKRSLGLDLERVLGMVREIVDATRYGWISMVTPIAIASPAYFTGKLSFGELLVVVGGFYRVNQSLRWFVDNFALLGDWRPPLSRVMKFREVLLMSENGYEQENRALHLRDFANHLRLDYGAASKGEKAVLDAIELDVARGGARSRCFQ
jgi:vitamin B12/bleomycin/antimicrobial peptide transport system ATP-binding/permease protein